MVQIFHILLSYRGLRTNQYGFHDMYNLFMLTLVCVSIYGNKNSPNIHCRKNNTGCFHVYKNIKFKIIINKWWNKYLSFCNVNVKKLIVFTMNIFIHIEPNCSSILQYIHLYICILWGFKMFAQSYTITLIIGTSCVFSLLSMHVKIIKYTILKTCIYSVNTLLHYQKHMKNKCYYLHRNFKKTKKTNVNQRYPAKMYCHINLSFKFSFIILC